jgi:GT2 family glycosyltransferase
MAPSVEPIVVDNASQDATRQHAAGTRIIANKDNRGFAAAANQGFEAADSQCILLLNPDVRLLSSIEPLEQECSRYGLAAGKLVGLDGRAQAGFTIRRFPTAPALIFELLGLNRLWPGNPVNRKYRYLDRALDQPGQVEQPAGAFLMIRRDVWQKLRGFDEGFHPIWFEDVDFCRRAVDAGFQIQYVPQVVASHAGGHSIRSISAGCRAWYWCVSLLRYAAKHFSNFGYRAVSGTVLFTSIPRMFVAIIRERSITPAAAYCKVAWFASQCLVSLKRPGAVAVRSS